VFEIERLYPAGAEFSALVQWNPHAKGSLVVRPILSLIFLALSLAYASGATAPIPLQIATQAAPPGGWTQIQIYANKPTAIASGYFALIRSVGDIPSQTATMAVK